MKKGKNKTKKTKKNIKKEENHGFTLVELLATIVIIGIVAGIGITIYTSSINKTKDNAKVLAIKNIKAAAELYSKEAENKKNWIKNYKDNTKVGYYNCITITDLINSGYLKENFYNDEIYDNKLNGNTYIELYQGNNYNDLEIKINETAGNKVQCISSLINEKILNSLELNNNKTYTDTLEFKIKPKVNVQVKNYTYTYSNGINEITNTCNNDQCTISNLKNYTDYPLRICLNTEEDQICEEFTIKTEDFVNQTLSIANRTTWKKSKDITIKYDNTNIRNDQKLYYFKSNIDATIKTGSVLKCTNQDNCTSVNKVTADSNNWYKATSENIVLTAGEENFAIKDNRSIIVKIMDNSNNYLDKTDEISKLDWKAPTCTSTASASDWTNNNVEVKGTCNDPDSGCKSPNVTITKTTEMNDNVSPGVVYDNAGNEATCPSKLVKIDKTPPTCSSTGGNTSWTKENVTLTGTCSDETNGSGCKDASVTQTVSTTYDGNRSPGTISDNAGNETTCESRPVKVDKSPPNCTTTGGSATWTKDNVTVTGTCNDGDVGSGCRQETVTVTKTTTTNGNVSPGKVYDNVGNETTCGSKTVKIDKTNPTVNLTGTNDNYTLTGSGSDSHSGIAGYKWDSSATWTSYSGGNIVIGKADGANHTFYVKDAVGNTNSKTLKAYKQCNKVTKEYDDWPDNSHYYNQMKVKTFKWSDASKHCSSTPYYREYTFNEYGCNCRYDVHTRIACSGATKKEYTSYTHPGGTAKIVYHNSDNGQKACNATIKTNSYVTKVCDSTSPTRTEPLDYHGYRFFYAATESSHDNLAATSYYTHNIGDYNNRVASSSTPEAACQKVCEIAYK